MTKPFIRDAELADAETISHLIIQTLRETNANDYSSAIIDDVIKNFSPNQVASRINQRRVFVVVIEGCIIGTASLEGHVIRSVFILPNKQMANIGSQLVRHIEKIAQEKNIPILTVPSSITAEGFYRKLGYKALRDEYHGEERTIIMEKHL